MELKAVFKIFQLRPGTIKNLHLGSLYRLESPKNQNSKVGPKNGLGSKGLKKKQKLQKRENTKSYFISIMERGKQKYPPLTPPPIPSQRIIDMCFFFFSFFFF